MRERAQREKRAAEEKAASSAVSEVRASEMRARAEHLVRDLILAQRKKAREGEALKENASAQAPVLGAHRAADDRRARPVGRAAEQARRLREEEGGGAEGAGPSARGRTARTRARSPRR